MVNPKKRFFHIDVNSAYLSWEAVHHLKHLGGKTDFRKELCAVAGDVELRHGIILAKSEKAKAFGIHTGESILEAKRKCPNLLLLRPHYELYEKCSKAMLGILETYSDRVEQYSIDEAFLDMTGSEKLWADPKDAAWEIKETIREKLGFSVNIGISSNKALAKMASDFRKPDLVHTLYPEEIKEKLWYLPIKELFFVGDATERKLKNLGIFTIGELACTDLEILRTYLKKHGEIIWHFANGRDISKVLETPNIQKGYGNSITIPFDVKDADLAKQVLLALSETVSARIRYAQVLTGQVGIRIKDIFFRNFGQQRSLKNATDVTGEIYEQACRLFEELWDGHPIRHLGVYARKIMGKDTGRQRVLFEKRDFEKFQKLDQAIDEIRKRYGIDSIKRAVFLDSHIDHMSGGISREKRTVDEEEKVLW